MPSFESRFVPAPMLTRLSGRDFDVGHMRQLVTKNVYRPGHNGGAICVQCPVYRAIQKQTAESCLPPITGGAAD
ncbi:hypothetical protein MnTg02_02030 [bacterium MnTg02]|nr:hypothetical protein MnTg02_02030 [bacterium MnTg02]